MLEPCRLGLRINWIGPLLRTVLYMPDNTTRKQFVFDCPCGNRFRVGLGKAGTFVRCDGCGQVTEIDSLTSMPQSSIGNYSFHRKTKLQFGSSAILLLFIPLALVCKVSEMYDWILLYGLALFACLTFLFANTLYFGKRFIQTIQQHVVAFNSWLDEE